MEYYEYSEDKTKCTYWLIMESCRQCLFETLCNYQNNQRILNSNNE